MHPSHQLNKKRRFLWLHVYLSLKILYLSQEIKRFRAESVWDVFAASTYIFWSHRLTPTDDRNYWTCFIVKTNKYGSSVLVADTLEVTLLSVDNM